MSGGRARLEFKMLVRQPGDDAPGRGLRIAVSIVAIALVAVGVAALLMTR